MNKPLCASLCVIALLLLVMLYLSMNKSEAVSAPEAEKRSAGKPVGQAITFYGTIGATPPVPPWKGEQAFRYMTPMDDSYNTGNNWLFAVDSPPAWSSEFPEFPKLFMYDEGQQLLMFTNKSGVTSYINKSKSELPPGENDPYDPWTDWVSTTPESSKAVPLEITFTSGDPMSVAQGTLKDTSDNTYVYYVCCYTSPGDGGGFILTPRFGWTSDPSKAQVFTFTSAL